MLTVQCKPTDIGEVLETIAKAATHIKETTDARIDADKTTNTRGGGGSAGDQKMKGLRMRRKARQLSGKQNALKQNQDWIKN